MIFKLICEYDAQWQPYQKIQIPYDSLLSAAILKELELPKGINFNYGVVIDGKAPNWLYSYLAYQCRNAAWIGCYNPPLQGAIVVYSNIPTVEVGQVKGCNKDILPNSHPKFPKLEVDEIITIEGNCYQSLLIHAINISPEALNSLSLPDNLDWNREVVLWGQAPVWLYTYLAMRCQHASWIACYNMKTTEAIIVISQHSQFIAGEKFKLVPKPPCPAIVFGGPPDSGKSLLAYTLKKNLVNMGLNNKVYLHRVAWDGEGDWFAEIMRTNPELAQELSEIAGRWKKPENLTEYFSLQAEIIKEIRSYTDLILVDLGGMPKEDDKLLLQSCTHYIIISNSSEAVEEWHEFFESLKADSPNKLIPLMVIHSVKEKKLEEVDNGKEYSEIIAGPWNYSQTETVPQLLLEEVMKLIPPILKGC